MSEIYVHGYHARESERLQDQAGTLVDLLHTDTTYPPGSRVLSMCSQVSRCRLADEPAEVCVVVE